MSDAYLHGVEVLEIDTGAAPIRAVATSVIGIIGTAPFADPAKFPLDTPVLITTLAEAALLTSATPGGTGTEVSRGTLPASVAGIFDQARAPIVVVRVDTNADPALQLAEVVGQSAGYQGVYALLAAQTVTGVQPRILCATGFTHQVPTGGDPVADLANPVVSALKAVAEKLRAVVVVDGPNTTLADALAKHTREGGDRVYMIDGHAKVLNAFSGAIVTFPASAHAAGRIARTDAEAGFWHSPSNRPLNGVLGVGRLVEFSLSDPTAESNVLNEAGIATIVALDGDYRLWGNRTSADVFLSVRRTADVIHDAVERSFTWALDKPQSAQLLEDVVGSVEAYGRELKARGAVLGFRAWMDAELNTDAAAKAGRRYINFDFLPPPPLERLTFQAFQNDAYFSELVALTSGQA